MLRLKWNKLLLATGITLIFFHANNSWGNLASSIPDKPKGTIRVATFNASLNRAKEDGLDKDLWQGKDEQIKNIAQIIQHVNPDILLINECDHDPQGQCYVLFQENFLKRLWEHSPNKADFQYYFTAPSNTGVPSGFDLDRDGTTDQPNDALGYGSFPGQYGMVIYSKFPIVMKDVRTFQKFLWKDMPNALLPDDPETTKANDWYSDEALAILPLSSKSHWDVPIQIKSGKIIHILASHPTPPVFDGPEDRNGKRNHDEIRFWTDYITPDQADYIYDDQKKKGGLGQQDYFIIMGDLNADPNDGDGHREVIKTLLQHPRLQPSQPKSVGAVEAAQAQGQENLKHRGDPALDTADFTEPPGNLRVDYVLPSENIKIVQSGVFWPSSEEALSPLVQDVKTSSDHHLVWVDVMVE